MWLDDERPQNLAATARNSTGPSPEREGQKLVLARVRRLEHGDLVAIPQDQNTVSHLPIISNSSSELTIIAAPLSALALIQRYTSCLAPTSMPRVGSSSSRIRGELTMARASKIFCWLPPLSIPIGCSGPVVRIPSSSISRSHIFSADEERTTVPRQERLG